MFKNVNWTTLLVGQVEQCSAKLDVMTEFAAVFEDVPSDKVKDRTAQLSLKSNYVPKFCPPRTVPIALKSLVETEIDNLVEKGYWSPVTESKWATPLVPVLKSNGSIRLCGDYKVTVNPQLHVAHHPLPTNEELFSKLANNSVFSKVDLSNAFNQLEMDELSKEVCTVNTPKGLFKVHRLPFGISSSPALWQRTVDSLLSGIEGVLCFVDDILVAGNNEAVHNSRLRKVFEILKNNCMHVRADKCEFNVDEVKYLGFKIDNDGIHKTHEKVIAIQSVNAPSCISELKGFLGLITFYGRFVPDLATTASPLYNLLRKDVPYVWSSGHQSAFDKLKRELCSSRFLVHYQSDLPLRLSCDASSVGLGIVLSHLMPDKSERPIAYGSRTLQKSELNYSQIDKEALSLVFGVKHFHYYLWGRHFTLITDHKPLISIFGEKSKLPAMVAARLQRYALTLSGYNYTIEFRRSESHGNADALSRLPINCLTRVSEIDQTILLVNSVKVPVSSVEISEATKADVILSKVHNCILRDLPFPSVPEFEPYRNVKNSLNIEGNVVLKDARVVIPKSLQNKLLETLHEEHMGVNKTKSLARSYVWWPSIDKDIENLILACMPCQSFRNCPPKVSSHSWEYPKGAWHRVHVDFAGPDNGVMFFIIVDAYTKWPEVFIMNSTTSTNCIRILKSVFSRFGLPYRLVGDNGPQLVSEEFVSFLSSYGIAHSRTAPYHPSTNGEAERFVQTFNCLLYTSDAADE